MIQASVTSIFDTSVSALSSIGLLGMAFLLVAMAVLLSWYAWKLEREARAVRRARALEAALLVRRQQNAEFRDRRSEARMRAVK